MTTDATDRRPAARIEVYLDGATTPFAMHCPPARFALDTTRLDDGPHTLRFVAHDGSGRRGVRTVRFTVRNGPGIAVDGVRDGDVVEGELALLLNAYGAGYEEHWEPSRAETPAPAPTWIWVLLLMLGAWAMFYSVRYWSPPAGSMGMHHAGRPTGLLAPVLLGASGLVVVAVLAAGARYFLRPGTPGPDHITRRILE